MALVRSSGVVVVIPSGTARQQLPQVTKVTTAVEGASVRAFGLFAPKNKSSPVRHWIAGTTRGVPRPLECSHKGCDGNDKGLLQKCEFCNVYFHQGMCVLVVVFQEYFWLIFVFLS